MRINNQIISWSEKVLIVVFFPVLVPAALALVAMFYLSEKITDLIGPSHYWRPWFAWYPVKAGGWDDSEWVWLEVVERRSRYTPGPIDYRRKQTSVSSGGSDD